MSIQTEFEFTLPIGYVDKNGAVHKHGVMRLATAMDEIAPLRDLRVRANDAYLVIILLSRVIVRLGDLQHVSSQVIENLFAADLAYLQSFYKKINEENTTIVKVICPECQSEIEVDLASLGGE